MQWKLHEKINEGFVWMLRYYVIHNLHLSTGLFSALSARLDFNPPSFSFAKL